MHMQCVQHCIQAVLTTAQLQSKRHSLGSLINSCPSVIQATAWTARYSGVQGTGKASQYRRNLNKAIRASVLGCYAWEPEADVRGDGKPAYYWRGKQLLADQVRQDY